ncbi:MAG: ParA family protein [Pseudoruegeria sp.]
MTCIAFASSKGGVGKTTSAIVLGTEFAEEIKVWMIDADPAARLYKWSSIGPLPKNLTVTKSGGERKILEEINDAKKNADIVLVDLEGSASRTASFVMGESDLVIVPSGEEQQDADEALETISEVALEASSRRKNIPTAVLFCRTNAAVKSRLEKHIHAEMIKATTVFTTELHRRTAYSALHNSGGGLRQLDRSEFSGVDKAIDNALTLSNEVIKLMTGDLS